MGRKIAFLLAMLLLVLCALLSGCEYQELDNLVLIAGMGIDLTEDGQYRVSVETISMSKNGEAGQYEPAIVEATGHTVLDAAANMIAITTGELQFSHCQVVIFGEDVARDGIEKIVDRLYMNKDFDINTMLTVAKGASASDILATKPLTARSQAFEIAETLVNDESVDQSFVVTLQDMFQRLHEPGRSPALCTVYQTAINGEKVVATMGAAIFKGDRLAGFLDGEQTRFYMYSINRIRNATLTAPLEDGNWFSTHIEVSNTRLAPATIGGALGFTLDVDAVASFAGYYPDGVPLETLSRLASQHLKTGIESLLHTAQTGLETDLLGFGILLWRKHPDRYFALEHPERAFLDAPFTVNVKVDVQGEGRFNRETE